MKRIAIYLTFLLVFLICGRAFAAGTVTITNTPVYSGTDRWQKILIAWVGDAANGSVPDTDIAICGTIQRVTTNPGSTAPTANYDITLIDEDGLDILTTGGANRHTTTSETFIPSLAGVTASTFALVTYCGVGILNLDNNSVNSATGTITIFLR